MASIFEAHFSDGRTAARRTVSVRLGNGVLVIEPDIEDDDNRTLTWAYDDLRLADELRRGRPVRLMNNAQSDARLTFTDNRVLEPLLALAPHLRGAGVLGHRPGLRIMQWAAGVAAVIAVIFFGLPRAAEPVAALMPLAWEEALGLQVLGGFQKQYGFCTNNDGVLPLVKLVFRLTGVVESRYKFRVTVVNDDAVNAYAAPGGYLVLNKGLLKAAQSPDDVAGVLAHEMGHVMERHSTEGLVRAAGLALIVQLLLGDPSGLLGIGVASGELLLSLAYNRDDEAEADSIAVDILAATGIDSAGFAHFLESLTKPADTDNASADPATDGADDGNGDIPFLSSHPRSAERAAIVRATGSPGGPAMSAEDWRKLQEICD